MRRRHNRESDRPSDRHYSRMRKQLLRIAGYADRVDSFRLAKNNRSKSAAPKFSVSPLIIKQFGRLFSALLVQSVDAPEVQDSTEIGLRGHHDWPVMPVNRSLSVTLQNLVG
jgi:hypothetical protein